MNRAYFNNAVKHVRKVTMFLDSVVGRTLYFTFYPYVPETIEEVDKARYLNKDFGDRFIKQMEYKIKLLNTNKND